MNKIIRDFVLVVSFWVGVTFVYSHPAAAAFESRVYLEGTPTTEVQLSGAVIFNHLEERSHRIHIDGKLVDITFSIYASSENQVTISICWEDAVAFWCLEEELDSVMRSAPVNLYKDAGVLGVVASTTHPWCQKIYVLKPCSGNPMMPASRFLLRFNELTYPEMPPEALLETITITDNGVAPSAVVSASVQEGGVLLRGEDGREVLLPL
jgi:hypothetical protein